MPVCQRQTGASTAWIDLYQASFPAEERAPVENIQRDLATGKRMLHQTLAESGEIACFSLTYTGFTSFIWLSYMATQPELRSGGVGTQHLLALLSQLEAEFPQRRGLLLEIESTLTPGLDEPTRTARQRRSRFYRRLGAKHMRPGLMYLMPSFVAGVEPIAAELLWYELGNWQVREQDLRATLPEIYTQIYGLAPGDPFIANMCAQF